MDGRSESPSRPTSELLLDLHILVVPRELWKDSLCSAENDVKMDSISAGFIRFAPDISMFNLRDEIEQQLDDDIIPKKFVFLKSVGSRFARLKSKQEFSIKAKYFAEPLAPSSELYILESSADFLPSGASSERSSQSTNRRYNGFSEEELLEAELLVLRRQREEEERLQREREEEERQRRAMEEMEKRRHEIEEAEAQRQREVEEENERRRREVEEAEAERKRRWEEDERRRREEEKRKWADEKRKEQERQAEERKRREEELRRAEEERKREEEEERMRRELEESRYPSPPALQISSVEKKDDKESLMAELSLAKSERREIEKRREDLVRKAKQLQTKAAHRRNQARDIWKKKYFEEKKKTAPIEEQCNKLRLELEQLHRKLVSQLEGSKDNNRRTPRNPSQQSTQKVAATKLQHEIDEYARRVENVKMKLTAEMKLRNQAETELRALRAELTQKKINVTLSRSQQMNVLGSSQDMYRSFTPMISPRDG